MNRKQWRRFNRPAFAQNHPGQYANLQERIYQAQANQGAGGRPILGAPVQQGQPQPAPQGMIQGQPMVRPEQQGELQAAQPALAMNRRQARRLVKGKPVKGLVAGGGQPVFGGGIKPIDLQQRDRFRNGL